MNDIVRDTTPVPAVEPVPFVSPIGAIYSKLGLDHIRTLTAIFERKAHLRFRCKLRIPIPILYSLGGSGVFRLLIGIGGALFGTFVALLQNGRVELDFYDASRLILLLFTAVLLLALPKDASQSKQFQSYRLMAACGPIADISFCTANVRFREIADMALSVLSEFYEYTP